MIKIEGGDAVAMNGLVGSDGNQINPDTGWTQVFQESITPLAASGVIAGAARSPLRSGGGIAAGHFNALVFADQASAASGFVIQASNDSVNWFIVTSASVVSNAASSLSVPLIANYYRAQLTNGTTAQTSLSLNTSFTL